MAFKTVSFILLVEEHVGERRELKVCIPVWFQGLRIVGCMACLSFYALLISLAKFLGRAKTTKK